MPVLRLQTRHPSLIPQQTAQIAPVPVVNVVDGEVHKVRRVSVSVVAFRGEGPYTDIGWLGVVATRHVVCEHVCTTVSGGLYIWIGTRFLLGLSMRLLL